MIKELNVDVIDTSLSHTRCHLTNYNMNVGIITIKVVVDVEDIGKIKNKLLEVLQNN